MDFDSIPDDRAVPDRLPTMDFSCLEEDILDAAISRHMQTGKSVILSPLASTRTCDDDAMSQSSGASGEFGMPFLPVDIVGQVDWLEAELLTGEPVARRYQQEPDVTGSDCGEDSESESEYCSWMYQLLDRQQVEDVLVAGDGLVGKVVVVDLRNLGGEGPWHMYVKRYDRVSKMHYLLSDGLSYWCGRQFDWWLDIKYIVEQDPEAVRVAPIPHKHRDDVMYLNELPPDCEEDMVQFSDSVDASDLLLGPGADCACPPQLRASRSELPFVSVSLDRVGQTAMDALDYIMPFEFEWEA